MTSVEVRPAIPADAEAVASDLRPADRTEVWAVNRLLPEAATRMAIEASGREAYAAIAGGRPIAIFGAAAPILGAAASPWLLGTPEVRRHGASLLRYTRQFVQYLFEDRGFKRLHNIVHAENHDAVRYLSAAGFRLSSPYECFTGAQIRDFYKEASDV